MTEETTDQEATDQTSPEVNGANETGMDALREELGKLRREKPRQVDLDVPGMKGKLVARYRRLDFEEVEKIGNRARRLREKHHPEAGLLAQADVLAQALIGIYLRRDMTKPEELESLSNAVPGATGEAGWDVAAKFLAKDGEEIPDSARGCVMFVFNNDMGLGTQQIELSEWMAQVRMEDEADFSLNF